MSARVRVPVGSRGRQRITGLKTADPAFELVAEQGVRLRVILPVFDFHVDDLVAGYDVRQIEETLQRGVGDVYVIVEVNIDFDRSGECTHLRHSGAIFKGGKTHSASQCVELVSIYRD